jgi:site-specific recombinase XerC
MWGRLVNPTALIPLTEPGDLRQDRVGQLIKRALDGVASDETRRAYRQALEMFLAFCGREGKPTLSAELVASYRLSTVGEGKSSSTVGVHLAAIKALTRAAVMTGLMPAEVAASINYVKGAPRRGNRIGNWLTRDQAPELLSLPDRESLKGKRDYAILALLLGCGLRRTELVSEVKVGAIAQRENRWVLVDITGRGNRVRSAAVPAWVKAVIDAWTTAAGITEGKIFRAVRKGGKIWGQELTPGAVCRSCSSTRERWVSKSWRRMTCAAPAQNSAASGAAISSKVDHRFRSEKIPGLFCYVSSLLSAVRWK